MPRAGAVVLDSVQDPLVSEEVKDGVLYKVKRRPSPSSESGALDDDEEKTLTLVAAPLDRLLTELLINRETPFTSIFLATYRAFTTPEYILQELIHQVETYGVERFISDDSSVQYFSCLRGSPGHTSASASTTSALASPPSADRSAKGWRARNTIVFATTWVKQYPEDFDRKVGRCDMLLHLLKKSTENTLQEFSTLADQIASFRDGRPYCSSIDSPLMIRPRSSGWPMGKASRMLVHSLSGELGGSTSDVSVVPESDPSPEWGGEPGDASFLPSSHSTTGMTRARMTEWETFSPSNVAVELTRIDSPLFVNVRAYECQAAIWGKRGKKTCDGEELGRSVTKTVEQFNRVCKLVMTSVLVPPSFIEAAPLDIDYLCSPPESTAASLRRAAAIEWWIETARECRAVKDYSSLRAILSSLKSSSIERLHNTWQKVDRDILIAFAQLSELTSTDSNEYKARELLTKEGTAKEAIISKESTQSRDESTGSNLHKILKRRLSKDHMSTSSPAEFELENFSALSRKKSGSTPKLAKLGKSSSKLSIGTLSAFGTISMEPTTATFYTDPWTSSKRHSITGEGPSSATNRVTTCGVVPYMGLFLTDMMMVDTAHPDYLPAEHKDLVKDVKLFNFTKRRKEFEILAQIMLFQQQATVYRFCDGPIEEVVEWIMKSEVMDEKQCYSKSLALEAKQVATKRGTFSGGTNFSDGSPVKGFLRLVRRSGKDRDTTTVEKVDECSAAAPQTAPAEPMNERIAHLALHPDVNKHCSQFQGFLVQNDGMKTRHLVDKVLERNPSQGATAQRTSDSLNLYQVVSESKFLLLPPDANLFYAVTATAGALCLYLQPKGVRAPTKLPSRICTNFWPK